MIYELEFKSRRKKRKGRNSKPGVLPQRIKKLLMPKEKNLDFLINFGIDREVNLKNYLRNK